ncbi:MAG: FkbM family methyltransferase [Halioglobus sp.]|jgi:FkbM family methyltransferase
MNSKFALELNERLDGSRHNAWKDNWDPRRFGPFEEHPLKARVKSTIRRSLEAVGLRSNRTLSSIRQHEEQLQWLYEQLQDNESRELLVQLMAYRTLGYSKVKLPLNTPQYWQQLDNLDSKAEPGESISLDFQGWSLGRYDLSDDGYPIQVYARPTGVFTQMLLQQYRCVSASHSIEVCEGETVIDAGGCYGDTALYFAHKVGASGRVLSFEFMPNNISVFEKNRSLNPSLSERIDIVPHPVWSTSRMRLYVEGLGPAARVTSTRSDDSSVEVETLCIDDLAQRENLKSVDFIKMDVEGAEFEALKGAEMVIRRDTPKLAISIYHNLHDFWTIPQWIDSLNLGYRFYIRHFTIHAEETVLFAEIPD